MKLTLPYKIEIEKADNGFILSYLEDTDDDLATEIKELIEIDDDAEDEREAIKRLLEQVAVHFGCSYDKFAKDNLEISFTKRGHKL